jgi:hypothetical protein
VAAGAAADVKWHDYPVAHFEAGDTGADFGHNAHVLVPENDPRLRRRAALIHMEVRTAYACGGHFDNGIVRMQDLRLGDSLHGDGKWLFIDNSFHA